MDTRGTLEASRSFAVVFRSFRRNYDGAPQMQFSIDQTNNVSITTCCDPNRLRGQVNNTLTALASESWRLEGHAASYICKGEAPASHTGGFFYSVRVERVCISCVDRTHE